MKLFNHYRNQMLAAAADSDRKTISDVSSAACADSSLRFLELLDLLSMEAELLNRNPDQVCI